MPLKNFVDRQLPAVDAAWLNQVDVLLNNWTDDIGGYAVREQVFTATAGQTLFTLTLFSYTPGVYGLRVLVDGFEVPIVETSSTSFTITGGVPLGRTVRALGGRYITTGVAASQVSSLSSHSSAVAQNQQDINEERLTSKRVGAGPSKSASYNRGALQDALDSGLGRLDIVTNRTGEALLIDAPLVVPENMEVQGYGRWGSVIRSTDLDAPVLRVNGDNVSIRGLHLSYQGTPLSGANAIEATGVSFLDLHRLWISSAWNSIYIQGGEHHEIIGLRCYSYENAGLFADGSLSTQLTNFKMSALARPGTLGGIRLLGGVEGFIATQGDITLGKYGLTTDTNGAGTRGNSPWFNRFSKVFFDSPLENPAYLRYLAHTDFLGCWFASGGHDAADTGFTSLTDHAGVDMDNCQHLKFTGGDIYGNGGNGVNYFTGNKHCTWNGVDFKRNGRYRSADRAGINVIGGATDFSVIGCVGERDADTTEFRQRSLVNVNTGASDRYFIVNNICGGTNIIDNGTGVDKAVTPNVGIA